MTRFPPFSLPDGLSLGCATAATQIEGGDRNNSWYEWAQASGHIRDGASPVRANRHWDLFEEDIRLMAEMGIREYRMGIEWSRVEPEEGVFDDSAMEHYRNEISFMLKHGIRPLVTLHHFTNPLWFEKMGAFESEGCVPIFRRFISYAVMHLRDLCSDYVTINEPNVYTTNGYIYGSWPPGRKSVRKAFRVMRNMTLCHLYAYRDIHGMFAEDQVRVGFANHLRVFVPYRQSPVYALEARILEYLVQGAMTHSMSTGRLSLPLGSGAPLGTGRFYDFIGINYYSRTVVRHFAEASLPGLPKNDLGWDIYPEGLGILCGRMYRKYRAPIWITENGTCDRSDRFRSAFLYDHLKQIADSGLPVERYYHWTFIDNFEWAEGESAPFGLVSCDFVTQERKVRPSGRFYSELISSRKVTPEMADKYLNPKV